MDIQDMIALLFVATLAGLTGRSLWRAVRRGQMCGSCSSGGCRSASPSERSPAGLKVRPLVTIGFADASGRSNDAGGPTRQ